MLYLVDVETVQSSKVRLFQSTVDIVAPKGFRLRCVHSSSENEKDSFPISAGDLRNLAVEQTPSVVHEDGPEVRRSDRLVFGKQLIGVVQSLTDVENTLPPSTLSIQLEPLQDELKHSSRKLFIT